MLKALIASLDDVEEKYRALYTELDNGMFELDTSISQTTDVQGLKNNNDKLKKQNLKLQEDAREIEEQAKLEREKKLEEENDHKGLMESREKTWIAEKQLLTAENETLAGKMKSSLLDKKINQVATILFGEDADILESQVRQRFQIVQDGIADFRLEILNTDGSVSAMKEDDLIEEMKSDKRLQRFIKGRNSSGGGSGGGGGAGDTTDMEKYFDRSDEENYNPEKQYEIELKHPEVHARLVKKFKLDDPFR